MSDKRGRIHIDSQSILSKISERFERINRILQTPITFENLHKSLAELEAAPAGDDLPRWREGVVYSLPQHMEVDLQVARGRGFCSRYAYARSTDTQNSGDIGQDYMVFNQDREKFIFAVCDGVSQSFFGNLAAKFLGDALIHWLSDLPEQLETTPNIRHRAVRFLTDLTPEATEIIQRHPLSQDIPALLRDVLEEKRMIGSETIFVAGRIILPCKAIPDGQILLVWMGDSRLRLWNPEQNALINLGGEFKTEQRWSTGRGLVRGEPQVFNSPFLVKGKPVFSLLEIYSDGLSILDDFQQQPISNYHIENLIKKAQAAPTSDDISYLAFYPPGYVGKRPY